MNTNGSRKPKGSSRMANTTDALLKVYEEQWAQGRQHQNQRATITNVVLLVASAIFGFISQQGLNSQTLPLAILLTAIGIFGAVACEKLYERSQLHFSRTRLLLKRIDELHPKAQLMKRIEEANADHKSKFPRMIRVHVHHLWLALHLTVILAGVVLILIIIL